MKESKFQKEVIDEIKQRFPGAIVLKNDPNYICGIPDLIVLWKDRWASLEVKRSKSAHHQPLQDYYVNLMDGMSFSRFISPENKEDVLNALERSFKSRRRTRIPRSK
ncbi:MAG: hypothetical protein KBS98_09010 [Flavobacterium sp.]|nr:hypothetical protein [Candidatus Neoflavobacterium equi]